METKRIVWIDDDIDKSILRPYVDEFEENGFEIIKIKSINNILHLLKNETKKISAILVDIIMPPMNLNFRETLGGLRTGLAVLKKIKEEDSLKDIPLITVTNVDDDEVKSFCLDKSIPCIEKKDYFSDEFVAKISEIINNRK